MILLYEKRLGNFVLFHAIKNLLFFLMTTTLESSFSSLSLYRIIPFLFSPRETR